MQPSFVFVGQVIEEPHPSFVRMEVCLSRRPLAAERGNGPTIYVTKYQGGQIGEQSFGVSPATARKLADLLLRAAALVE